MSNLPTYYHDIIDFIEITKAEDIEFTKAEEAIERAFNNQFVMTSDEYGVKRHEKILKIVADPTIETLDFRKKRIISRYSAINPFTIRYLKNALNFLAGNGNVHIDVDVYKFLLEITIDVKNNPIRKEINNTVNQIKPANLLYSLITEINSTMLWIIENTYDFHVAYPVCGDMELSEAHVTIEEDEMRVTEASYDFEVEYEINETKVCSPSEDIAKSIDKTYDFPVEYPICGEMQPPQADVHNKHYKSTTKDNSYTVNVVYPVCGDFVCGEGIT